MTADEAGSQRLLQEYRNTSEKRTFLDFASRQGELIFNLAQENSIALPTREGPSLQGEIIIGNGRRPSQVLSEIAVDEWGKTILNGMFEARFSLLNAQAVLQIMQDSALGDNDGSPARFLITYYLDNAAHRLYSTRERVGQFLNESKNLGLKSEPRGDGGPKQPLVSFDCASRKVSQLELTAVAEVLEPLASQHWTILEDYRNQEAHRLDPLVTVPETSPPIRRLFPIYRDGVGKVSSVEQKNSYAANDVLAIFIECYRSLVEFYERV